MVIGVKDLLQILGIGCGSRVGDLEQMLQYCNASISAQKASEVSFPVLLPLGLLLLALFGDLEDDLTNEALFGDLEDNLSVEPYFSSFFFALEDREDEDLVPCLEEERDNGFDEEAGATRGGMVTSPR